jgi:maltose alpha-D-glucosyltransferase / alpha-amylase
MGLVQEFVRSQGSGWDHAISYLDRVFDTLRVVDHKAEEVSERERHAIYLEQVRILARRIAEMHRALSSDAANPEFRPERVTAAEVDGWRRQLLDSAEATFDVLQAARKSASEADAAKIADIAGRKKECTECLAALAEGPVTASKIRIHGDLHLGQILVAQNDFYVIDFEGEPARPLAERRAKSLAYRDVAGMLRSFEYAGWSALHKLADRDNEGFARLLPRADAWRQLVQATFLETYREAIAGCSCYPAEPAEADRLLKLFLLDKLLYEIRYEAANRPTWLRIPLSGLGPILDSAAKTKEKTLVPT